MLYQGHLKKKCFRKPSQAYSIKKTEKELFLAAVKDAFPLKKNPNKASVKKAKPKPIPYMRNLDEEGALEESQFSDFTEETLLDTDDSLFFTRTGISRKSIKKLRKGFWSLRDELDLQVDASLDKTFEGVDDDDVDNGRTCGEGKGKGDDGGDWWSERSFI